MVHLLIFFTLFLLFLSAFLCTILHVNVNFVLLAIFTRNVPLLCIDKKNPAHFVFDMVDSYDSWFCFKI